MIKPPQASDVELQVLSVLWDNGPATVREVLEAMPDGKTRAYTTILTILQIMEKKGLVDHTTANKTHTYAPKVQRQQIMGPLLTRLAKTVFGDRPMGVLQCLMEERKISAEELDELQRVLSQYTPTQPPPAAKKRR